MRVENAYLHNIKGRMFITALAKFIKENQITHIVNTINRFKNNPDISK